MSATRKRCSCKNTFQDSKYGKGIRIMNKMDKKDGYRCTSCTKEHA